MTQLSSPPSTDARPDISVCIPVYREAQFLEELTRRLVAVLDEVGRSYEIVFADDGSQDGSLAILRRLCRDDERVHVVKLTRNFGQMPATVAAIQNSRGAVIITMDADLQNLPEDIPLLLAKIDEGYRVVHGIRLERHEGVVRKLGSAYVQWLLRRIGADVPPDVTSYRALTRPVADMVLQYRECNRFLVPVIAWTGARAAFVPVRYLERNKGGSGYSIWRLLSITLELVISVSYIPLRASVIVGFVLALVSLVIGAVTFLQWVTGQIGVPGFTSIVVIVSFLSGVQLVFMGVLGEYLARVYIAQKERPAFHVDWVDEVDEDVDS